MFEPIIFKTIVCTYYLQNHCLYLLSSIPLIVPIIFKTLICTYCLQNHCLYLLSSKLLFVPITFQTALCPITHPNHRSFNFSNTFLFAVQCCYLPSFIAIKCIVFFSSDSQSTFQTI